MRLRNILKGVGLKLFERVYHGLTDVLCTRWVNWFCHKSHDPRGAYSLGVWIETDLRRVSYAACLKQLNIIKHDWNTSLNLMKQRTDWSALNKQRTKASVQKQKPFSFQGTTSYKQAKDWRLSVIYSTSVYLNVQRHTIIICWASFNLLFGNESNY